ncbi:hypothetical protein Sps_00154 [Shewanella psychrophila]|uniref:Uncharacterized protein n=2 Tax=Shewanella psychrophila TaxID=225848 RepID=A0A1S6HIP9_9GAMM|nr:hypothetical protein Sps_00154 [Shewanella psychrophila]
MLLEPKFLFVPVSTPEGIGEYMRSKIIADEVMNRWPNAKIDFVLNRHVSYVRDCPYSTHLVDDTPTKKTREVNQLITDLKPDVVIFDAAGRKAQLQHAHRMGAKVIFISQHRRKRSRGMKVERALVTDSHWVVQPEFAIGDISRFDKLKLNLIKCSFPIFTGSIFKQPDVAEQQQLQIKYGIQAGQYLLYSAGSGGHMLKSGLAADLFAQVAKSIFTQTGLPSLMVLGPNYPKSLPEIEGVTIIPQLDHCEFINLLQGAKAAVLSGGDTLLQAIALNIPSLVVAVSKDQPSRISKCYKAGLISTSAAEVEPMCIALTALLSDKSNESIGSRTTRLASSCGLEIGMAEIERLLHN